MDFHSTKKYLTIVNQLIKDYKIPDNITYSLSRYVFPISRSELGNHFSTPMFWIGMYIALASMVCILAMVADLLHGFHSRKLWFPCKYFRINAAFLTVISVAMKLPVDLTGSMMGDVDKVAKLGSMAFMCTMMANLLPCLATMGANELLSNIIALCVLVITLVVNVCIQIQTGVLNTYVHYFSYADLQFDARISTLPIINQIASIYVILLVVLLVVHVCSSVALLRSKEIIETKYQQGHGTSLKEMQPSPGELLLVEKLHKHVSNHWIMAGSGSPQFIIACFHTTSASGVICLLVTLLHTYTLSLVLYAVLNKDYGSDYGWSMMVILLVQFIGVVIGTIAPLSRCVATLRISEWSCSSMQVNSLDPIFVYDMYLVLFPLKKVFPLLGNKFERLEGNNDLSPYILQLEDEIELGERTLKGLLKSGNRLIQKGAKSQPNNLMKLIAGSSTSSFEGVKMFAHNNDHDVPSVYCWGLAVVTLTTIANSLPEIKKEEADSLLESVREGLEYVTVVEKSLNNKNDHVSAQKAAATMWQEIRFDKKWLGNQLQNPAFQVNTARVIVEWFMDKAKNVVCSADKVKDDTGGDTDDLIHKSICANSMYHITETIMLISHTNIDVIVSRKKLFDILSSMIADIIAACLTNLPQAITMKCHTSVIEEREATVKDAAQLLGETTQIIKILEGHEIPSMNPNDMPFLNKWCAYLGNT